MSDYVKRLVDFKNALTSEYQTTVELLEKLHWYDRRCVYKCYDDLFSLGFPVKMEKINNHNCYKIVL